MNRFLGLCVLAVIFVAGGVSAQKANSAVLKGRLPFLKDGDTVQVYLYKYGIPIVSNEFDTMVYVRVANGEFNFSAQAGNAPLYFALLFDGVNNSRPLVGSYYLNDGDSVLVGYEGDHYTFMGRGGERLSAIGYLTQLAVKYSKAFWGVPEHAALHFAETDSFVRESYAYIQQSRNVLPARDYELMKIQIAAVLNGKGVFINILPDSLKPVAFKFLQHYKAAVPQNVVAGLLDIDPSLAQYNSEFIQSLIEKYHFESGALAKKPVSFAGDYTYFKNTYTGVLRERLLLNLLYSARGREAGFASYCADAAAYIKDNPDFVRVLADLNNTRKEGMPAFNFRLPGENRQYYGASDFANKVLVLDFWFTGCGACIQQKPYLEKIRENVDSRDVVFVSISSDKNYDKWIKSVRSGRYTSKGFINLYSDEQGEKHPIFSYYKIEAFPTLIVIDKEGKLMAEPVDPRRDGGDNMMSIIRSGLREQ